MSGTKEEAVGYVFMDLSSPRMLPCSLDTSFKKDIGGLQYDIRGRAGGKKSTAPHTHTHTLSSSQCFHEQTLPCSRLGHQHGDLTPSSISTLVTLSHPSSLLQPPVALPSCSFLSEHSVLFLPLPCCKL